MASDSFPTFDRVPNDDDPPTIEVEYIVDFDGNVPVIPHPHPVPPQYVPPASYQILDRLDMNLNSSFLFPTFHRAGSDSGSDNQSIASCPPSPSPSSYHGSFSPESQNLGHDFDQLSVERHVDGSPVIPFNSNLLPMHSPQQEGPSFSSGYHSDFGYSTQNQTELLHANYQQIHFYNQTTQNMSSRSLPDYLTSPGTQQEDYATTQLRRHASSSSMSSSGQFGPYTPEENTNNYFQGLPPNFESAFRDFTGVPSLIQSGTGGSGSASPHSNHSNSIDMHPIHEFIKDRSDVQAVPPDAEELRRVFAAKSPGSRPLFKKSAKTSVSTPAGHLASEKRRKNPGRFLCTLKDCSATFTRKLGLDNHLKSHLGIMDQKCDFCQRSFSTSLGRHMKRCKQNPNRQETPSSKETK